MPLTGEFRDTVRARAECDPEFRAGLLNEAIEALLSNDLETGKVLLRNYVSATVKAEPQIKESESSPENLTFMPDNKGVPFFRH